MDTVGSIIHGLNKEEVRFFKLYHSRMKTGERKDILLFDFIRKNGKEYQEEKIFDKLYESGNKNAFYRLRNRLMSDINKCLLLQHFEEEESLVVINQLALSRLFISKGQIEVAAYFLRKAEAKATSIENFELVDLIYGEFIRLSHELLDINPETYITLRQENQVKIRQLRSIDDVVAVLSYRLKITQNFARSDQSVLELLQRTVDDFLHDPEIRKSPKFRFRIYTAVSQILLQNRDYVALEEYLTKTYREFTRLELFSKTNHDIKLQMLTYLVNSFFKNGKLKSSLQYADLLKDAMEEFGRLHYDKYLFFYYNALVINYSILDKQKAIKVLEDLKENRKITATPFYEIFIYLNLAVLHFDLAQYRDSIRFISKLYQLNSYQNADSSLQLKISVVELMVRFELHDFDYLEYRIRQIKKDFRQFLRQPEFMKEKEFLGIILQLDYSKTIPSKLNKINQFIDNYKDTSESDDEIINYGTWLSDKIKKKRGI
jgi:tetratricopeptide (TPR) repeat protein